MASTASRVLELFTSHWVSAILASAVELDVFNLLARSASTVSELSSSSGVPQRSLQALLDGLFALDLVVKDSQGRYSNSETAENHLVRGKPAYLGGFGQILSGPGDGGMRQWSMLPTALRHGKPILPETIVEPDNPFWPELVKVLTPLSREVATIAADLVGIRSGRSMSVLDIGGGAGAYAEAWLALNPLAQVTQLDWAPVNALAKENLSAHAFGDRFKTLDGDLHTFPFGSHQYDVVVLSNICHHESPAGNVALLRKVAAALLPGGHVVVSDFVLYDDKKGPTFAALFGAGMVLQTPEGASYFERDYHEWFKAAGFEPAQVNRTHPLSTVLVATPR